MQRLQQLASQQQDGFRVQCHPISTFQPKALIVGLVHLDLSLLSIREDAAAVIPPEQTYNYQSLTTATFCFIGIKIRACCFVISWPRLVVLISTRGVHLQVAAYEFTTLTCIPGVVHYRGAKIQMLDLPGIIEGAKDGKGRGRQVHK